MRPLPFSGPLSFGRGVEVSVEFDENAFDGTGAFLLGAILERFFAKYVSINSFSETVLRTLAARGDHAMAGEQRAAPDPQRYSRVCRRSLTGFDFFQTLRRFECVYRERARVGRSQRPGEIVLLGTDPELTFAPAAISSLPGQERPCLRASAYASSALSGRWPAADPPDGVRAPAAAQPHGPDVRALRRRLPPPHAEPFYRAWADARPAVAHDRPRPTAS